MAASTSWLGLLAADAPAEELEAHRVAALAAAGSDAEREEVDAEARRALHLRALLSERRQRSAELSALLDLARRLSAYRDVDALLQEIVTQARQLLGVDVAYLALIEPDGALRIRVTDGAVGDTLRGAQLSPRTGIAGRVATSGEPFRTPDYITEPAIEHAEETDAIAQREGMSAIAGVPLRAGDRVVGVLFASERARRDFTDAEVSLLASLGAHAAIAIENARLFEELVLAHDTTSRAVALHERLTDVVLRGGSADDVLRALNEVVPGAISLEGPGVHAVDVGAGHRTVVPVTAGEDSLGSLIAVTDQPPSAADVRLLERSALTIALVLLADRAVAEAQSRTRSELLVSLLAGTATGDATTRLRSAGVDLRQPQWVAVVDAPRAVLDDLDGFGLAAEHDGALVCVAPGTDAGLVVAELTRRLARSGATTAVDGPAVGAPAVAASYDEARRGLGLLAALGRSGAVATVDELGPFRYLFARAGADDALRFIERTIGPLLAHDKSRGSDLTRTLDIYLQHAQQHAASAAAIGIHANTLYQRLGRVGELLGDEWRGRALELHLAIKLHHLSQEISFGAEAPVS